MGLWKLGRLKEFRKTPHKVESRKSPGRVGLLRTSAGGILYPTPVSLLSSSGLEWRKYKKIFTAEVAPLDLKIQLTYEQQTVKDAEAESKVLRKRLRESKDESQRFHQMYWEMLLRKKELKEEVENLKQSLTVAKIKSPKSEEAKLS